jgi:hypothetical protein
MDAVCGAETVDTSVTGSPCGMTVRGYFPVETLWTGLYVSVKQ